jgi:Family of unknown function (DUF6510)
MEDSDRTLDGNAAAGALSEVFAAEMTLARATCGSCGDRRPVAELRLYADAPGLVLRCATCSAVLLRLVRTPDRVLLEARGTAVLELAPAE